MDWNDEQLRAYSDELLDVATATALEQQLRADESLRARLQLLLAERDQGGHSIGEIWRREAISCPQRFVLVGYLAGQLGDGLHRYVEFHLQTIGCRRCAANVEFLQTSPVLSDEDAARIRRIAATSLGAHRQATGDP